MRFISELFQCAPGFMAVLLGPDHRFELSNAACDELVQDQAAHGIPLAETLPEVAEQGVVDLLDQVYRSGTRFRGQDVEVVLHRGGHGRDLWHFHRRRRRDRARPRVETPACGAGSRTDRHLRVISAVWRADGVRYLSPLMGIGPDMLVTDSLLLGLVDTACLEYSGSYRFGKMDNSLEYVEYPIRRANTCERRWIARKGQLVRMHHEQEPRYLGVAFDMWLGYPLDIVGIIA
jgi:hypothetical protein